MCAVLEISPKIYYKYRNKEDPNYYDYLIIKEIFNDFKGNYGYRRIVEGFKKKYGVEMNEGNVKPNLLNRNFDTDAPNKVCDTDVTYLIRKGARTYYLQLLIYLIEKLLL